jgi:hypothetical protein
VDNYAPYGSDLASIPARIRYEIPPNDGGNKIFLETKTLQIASGQEFQLLLYIEDNEGRVYKDEQ